MDRSLEFANSADAVREPQFHTMQQITNPGYRKISTLDQLLPSGNGMAAPDKQRLIYGLGHSPMGESSDTFDKSIWLRNNPSNSLYNLNNKPMQD